ncbi:MAG: AAA family ATPase [Gammaproteobacteria bacterium]|nr:AAA family ATPase [Gammaproteobacteria bacterium]HXK56373.1 AAA family ATPase [Gammaproteobacteria bacterium]
MKIIATYNLKGGVGKTSTAINMAYLAAKEGYRTLLWDFDPQGAASFCFRVKPKLKGGIGALRTRRRSLDDVVKATDFTGLDLIPADFSFRNFDQVFSDTKNPSKQLMKLLFPISREYDLLFIDCAPSISLASENIFYAADALLIPLIPTTFSVRTFNQLLTYFNKAPSRHLMLLPFFSMYDKRRLLHRQILVSLPKEFKGMLNTPIPYSKSVELMGIQRAPVGSFAPQSSPAHAYIKLWREVQAKLLANKGV